MEEFQDTSTHTPQVRSEQPERISVFVMMPFGNRKEYAGENRESNHVFNEIIKPAVECALPKPIESPSTSSLWIPGSGLVEVD